MGLKIMLSDFALTTISLPLKQLKAYYKICLVKQFLNFLQNIHNFSIIF